MITLKENIPALELTAAVLARNLPGRFTLGVTMLPEWYRNNGHFKFGIKDTLGLRLYTWQYGVEPTLVVLDYSHDSVSGDLYHVLWERGVQESETRPWIIEGESLSNGRVQSQEKMQKWDVEHLFKRKPIKFQYKQ